jgi:hypothetical protein
MRGSHKLVAGADGAGREAGLPTGWRSAVEEAAAGIGAGGERRRSADCGAGRIFRSPFDRHEGQFEEIQELAHALVSPFC